MSKSPSDESPDEDSVFPFIIISLTEDRGQTQFCHNLIANIFEQGISPCKAEFPEIKIKIDDRNTNCRPFHKTNM